MPIISIEKLNNANLDAETIEQVVNGEPNVLVESREGRKIPTLATLGEKHLSAGVILYGEKTQEQVNDEVDNALNLKADIEDVDAALNLKADKSYVDNQGSLKADKTYVDVALSNLNTQASKFYPTLAEADADIANITVNQVVNIGEVTNGGLWYKATADATSLTKSAYDPLNQSKTYTDDEIEKLPINTADVSNLIFGITDNVGKLAAFPQTGLDGNPTQDSAKSIYASIQQLIINAITIEVEKLGYSIRSSEDFIFQLIDANGVRSCLEIKKDGTFSEWAIECIKNGLINSGFSFEAPSTYKSAYQDKEFKIVSGPNICCDGDSMTQGTGSTNYGITSYPPRLKAKLAALGYNVDVKNQGVGGETSTTIAARVGGYPLIIKINDGVLPSATTAVRCTLELIGGEPVRPLLQGAASINGVLNGIPVTLAIVKPNGGSTWDEANYYTIARRSASTSATTINRPANFYTDISKAGVNDIHVIWVGQNNPESSPDRAIADARAIIDSLDPIKKRYVVMSRAGGTSAQDADDVKFFREFGRNFIAVRQYMVKYGLQDAGLTQTAEDEENIAAGITPRSLRVDSVHGNDYYYDIVAQLVINKLIELEYV